MLKNDYKIHLFKKKIHLFFHLFLNPKKLVRFPVELLIFLIRDANIGIFSIYPKKSMNFFKILKLGESLLHKEIFAL
jgi:hypothetical protein